LKIFLDSMVGGAWPFLVGGVICLVNSVNERDLDLLNSPASALVVLDLGALLPLGGPVALTGPQGFRGAAGSPPGGWGCVSEAS
jgi:hypothetical protein